ncbi:MAG: biopolymer transporter ExbD [Sandaracinaceae bacterium]|nr:biopolymer transporter ExbD [Sandaracinaceae bacterium]
MAMDLEAPSGGRKGKKAKSKPEMNVTPLVDVVLVLLIIFMVVMPAMQRFFWVHVPPENQDRAEQQPDQDAPIVVTVNERGELRINQDVYPDAVFPVRLRRMLVARGDRKIYFDAADTAPFERAVEAMDLSRGAGAAHIAVMTERLR